MPPRSKKNKGAKKKQTAVTETAPTTGMSPSVQSAIDAVVASHSLDVQAILASSLSHPLPDQKPAAPAPPASPPQKNLDQTTAPEPAYLPKASAGAPQPLPKSDAPPPIQKDKHPSKKKCIIL